MLVLQRSSKSTPSFQIFFFIATSWVVEWNEHRAKWEKNSHFFFFPYERIVSLRLLMMCPLSTRSNLPWTNEIFRFPPSRELEKLWKIKLIFSCFVLSSEMNFSAELEMMEIEFQLFFFLHFLATKPICFRLVRLSLHAFKSSPSTGLERVLQW